MYSPPPLAKYLIFPEGMEGLYTGYDPVVILGSNPRRRCNLTMSISLFWAQTDSTNYNYTFQIFFQPNGQLTMPLYNRPILAHTQIWFTVGDPEQGFWRCLTQMDLSRSLVPSSAGYLCVLRFDRGPMPSELQNSITNSIKYLKLMFL